MLLKLEELLELVGLLLELHDGDELLDVRDDELLGGGGLVYELELELDPLLRHELVGDFSAHGGAHGGAQQFGGYGG